MLLNPPTSPDSNRRPVSNRDRDRPSWLDRGETVAEAAVDRHLLNDWSGVPVKQLMTHGYPLVT